MEILCTNMHRNVTNRDATWGSHSNGPNKVCITWNLRTQMPFPAESNL